MSADSNIDNHMELACGLAYQHAAARNRAAKRLAYAWRGADIGVDGGSRTVIYTQPQPQRKPKP